MNFSCFVINFTGKENNLFYVCAGWVKVWNTFTYNIVWKIKKI